jgi:hypothetical protein
MYPQRRKEIINDDDMNGYGGPEMDGYSSLRRRKPLSQFDETNMDLQQRPGPNMDFEDCLDEGTRQILERSRNVRKNPVPVFEDYDPERKISNNSSTGFNDDDEDEMMARYGPPPDAGKPPRESMLGSKTRSALDKLKESTQALNALSTGTDDFLTEQKKQVPNRKKSRFLRNQDTEEFEEPKRFQTQSDAYEDPSRLANDILGIRNDSMGEFDKYRPEFSSNAPRKSQNKKYDFDINGK